MSTLLQRGAEYALGDTALPSDDQLQAMYDIEAAYRAPESVHDYAVIKVAESVMTPANAMTFTRPILGALAARRLLRGREDEKVVPLVLSMALSDAEGKVARAADNHSIKKNGHKSKYGTSELGKAIDPIADTIGFLEVAGAALKAPRVSKLGKFAVGIVLTTEGVKSGWAVKAGLKHKKKTGEQLVLDVTKTGKLASGEKFTALILAAATHDLEPGRKRTMAGVAAIGMALLGAFHGEKARHGYKKELAANDLGPTTRRPKAERTIT